MGLCFFYFLFFDRHQSMGIRMCVSRCICSHNQTRNKVSWKICAKDVVHFHSPSLVSFYALLNIRFVLNEKKQTDSYRGGEKLHKLKRAWLREIAIFKRGFGLVCKQFLFVLALMIYWMEKDEFGKWIEFFWEILNWSEGA